MGNNSPRVQPTAPPRAPEEESTFSSAGHIFSIKMTAPSAAITGFAFAALLISVTASFRRWQASRDAFQPNARERNRALNVHLCFGGSSTLRLSQEGVAEVLPDL